MAYHGISWHIMAIGCKVMAEKWPNGIQWPFLGPFIRCASRSCVARTVAWTSVLRLRRRTRTSPGWRWHEIPTSTNPWPMLWCFNVFHGRDVVQFPWQDKRSAETWRIWRSAETNSRFAETNSNGEDQLRDRGRLVLLMRQAQTAACALWL